MFITMTYLVLDAGSGRLLLSRAGHRPALIHRHVTGQIEPVAPIGLAVGIDDGDVFERVICDRECHLDSGDVMLLYTDGLTEALNPAGEEYGGNASTASCGTLLPSLRKPLWRAFVRTSVPLRGARRKATTSP